MHEPDVPRTEIPQSAEAAERAAPEDAATGVERKWLEYFGLHEQPFGVTPDPRFLYLSNQHKQALAVLNYGTESNRGFLTLIAPPGVGKTSLLFTYLEGLRDHARTAFVFQTDCDSRELMAYMLADLGVKPAGGDLPEMRAALNRVLTEQMNLGRRFVLVIDEAQNLKEEVLESVRLLSNFETPWMKLMQIVLAGQPELADRLAKPSMAQLRQRVSLEARIGPLTNEEVNAYVEHRLLVAGYKGAPLFSLRARNLLVEASEGIPRKINNICFCAMSLAWATKQKTVDPEMMRDVLADDAGPAALAEKAPSPSRGVELAKPRAIPPAAVLTTKESSARSRLPKVIFTAVLLGVLAWFGTRTEVSSRVIDFWRNVALSGKTAAAPAAIPVQQVTPASAGNSSAEVDSQSGNEENPEPPHDGGAPRNSASPRQPD